MLELGVSLASTYDENGFIGIQIDAFGGPDAAAHFEQLSHQYGFASRALDPEAGIGCSLFRWGQGRNRHVWLADDPRLVDKIPRIKKGGSVQYASDGSFANFDPETHTWTLYVPYSDSPAKAHLVTVGKDGNGTPVVELSSGEGPAITILDKVTTLKNASGSSYIFLDDAGTTVVGPFKAAGGADIGGPTSQPLVKAPELMTELAAIQAALAAIGAALASIGPQTLAPPTVAPQVTAAATAITAAAAALTAFGLGGPTLTTKGA